MTHLTFSKFLGFFGLIAVLFVGAACDSTNGTAGRVVEVVSPVEVHKGMEAADLLAALGEPYEVRPTTPPVEGSEIWVYRKVSENVALVLSGTVQTPGMEIGGVQMTITDNVYTPATTRYVEETMFLMVNGIMIAWKVDREGSEHLN